MPEIAYRRFAVVFAVVLVLGFAGIAAHSALTREHRAELEHWSQPTAVGDQRLYPLNAEAPALTFEGKPLIPIDGRAHDMRETHAVLAGEDDSKHYRVYLLTEEDSKEAGKEPVYLLKIGARQFLKMQLGEKK